MFIETSKDLLFVILGFCILWLTIFLSWLLYYVIAILRDTESLLHRVRGAVDKVDELAHAVHEKVERSAGSLTLLSQAFKQLVMWAIEQHRDGGKKSAMKKGRRNDDDDDE